MTRIGKITLLFFIVFAMTSTSCFKNNFADDGIKVYSNVEDIVNPPDEFQIVFRLRTSNNYQGIVVFEHNSVWEIEKLTAFSSMFWIEHVYPERVEKLDFGQLGVNKYQVGFAGGTEYHFWANNNTSLESRNLFVSFKRLDNDYDIFEPKF